MEEEEDDLLKGALDCWSEAECCWKRAVKMKGQEVPVGRNGTG